MKQHSTLLKDIDTRLADTKQCILDHFHRENSARQASAKVDEPLIRQRAYRGAAAGDYSIQLDEETVDPESWNRYAASNRITAVHLG